MNNDDWKSALDEVDLPQPAPGKKIITFSLPPLAAAEEVKPRRRAKPKPAPPLPLDFTALNREDYAELSGAPRRRAREAALLLLFALSGGSDWQQAEGILADVGVGGENADFALELARQAQARQTASDQLLSRYARDWELERFSAVDRCVLRLAVPELLLAEGDERRIVINEAVELGKKFGSEDSGAFVNAILDSIYQQQLKEREQR